MLQIKQNISLKEFSTFKVGGNAKYFAEIHRKEEAIEAIKYANEKHLPILMLGKGSNVLISDEGFDGLVMVNKISGIEKIERGVRAFSGELLNDVVDLSIKNTFDKFYKLSWIPGTLGGAVTGNAGAYGVAVGDFVSEVVALDTKNGSEETFTKEECNFSYRSSVFKTDGGYFVLSISLNMETGNAEEIKKEYDTIMEKRKNSLPKLPSCGCDFKNLEPAEYGDDVVEKLRKLSPKTDEVIQKSKGKLPAGFIIETIGLKGCEIGGAKVSDEHANIIVNYKNATANDIFTLINKIQGDVKDRLGIEIEKEIQFVGKFN